MSKDKSSKGGGETGRPRRRGGGGLPKEQVGGGFGGRQQRARNAYGGKRDGRDGMESPARIAEVSGAVAAGTYLQTVEKVRAQ